jgi:hypothetical protein
MSLIQELGIQSIAWLQQQESSIGGVMDFFALLVRPEFVMIFLLPLLVWNSNYRLFATLFLFLMIDIMLGDIAKVLLAQPRPWWIADLQPFDAVTSVYSSPAGYTSMATVFWGYLFVHLRKPCLLIAGSSFILISGIAKMYHAATLPDHIVLGFIQGLIELTLYIKFKDKLADIFYHSSRKKSILLTTAITASFFGLMTLAFMIHSTYQIPLSYLEYKMIPADRFAGGGITMAGGLFFGGLIGQILLSKSGLNLINDKNLSSRLVISTFGLVVLALLMALIRQILVDAQSDRLGEGIVNFTFTTMCGFFMFYGIQRLFYKHPLVS